MSHRLFVAAGVIAAATIAGAAPQAPWKLSGELVGLSVTADGGAVMTVANRRLAVPAQVRWRLPGQDVSTMDLFAQAPAECVRLGETGLLRADACVRERRIAGGARVTVSGEGQAAAEIAVAGGQELVSGGVTFVNPAEGYLRVGGIYGMDEGGAVVRLNDPLAALSIQQGRGCAREANCSPDVRFRIGTAEPTVRFSSGPVACVPALADLFCPAAQRRPGSPGPAPIRKGDHAGAVGDVHVISGERVLFAHTLVVQGSGLS